MDKKTWVLSILTSTKSSMGYKVLIKNNIVDRPRQTKILSNSMLGSKNLKSQYPKWSSYLLTKILKHHCFKFEAKSSRTKCDTYNYFPRFLEIHYITLFVALNISSLPYFSITHLFVFVGSAVPNTQLLYFPKIVHKAHRVTDTTLFYHPPKVNRCRSIE